MGNHYNWEKVLGNVVWSSGKHRMEFLIDFNMLVSNNMWQIIVGVAHPSTDLVSCLGDGEREWGMMCLSGQKIHKVGYIITEAGCAGICHRIEETF